MRDYFLRLPTSERSVVWLALFFPVSVWNLLKVAYFLVFHLRGGFDDPPVGAAASLPAPAGAAGAPGLPRDWWVALWCGLAGLALLLLTLLLVAFCLWLLFALLV